MAARAYFAARLRDPEREELCAAYLDATGRVLGGWVLAGGVDHVPIPIRRLFADALELDARALVLAHTHPAGGAEPSADDLVATRRVAETADALGIRFHDHLILLPGGGTVSFRDRGLL